MLSSTSLEWMPMTHATQGFFPLGSRIKVPNDSIRLELALKAALHLAKVGGGPPTSAWAAARIFELWRRDRRGDRLSGEVWLAGWLTADIWDRPDCRFTTPA